MQLSSLPPKEQVRNLTQADIEKMPEHWLGIITVFLDGVSNENVDFRRPLIRTSVTRVYGLVVLLYASLIFFGVIANVSMIVHVYRKRLWQNPTFYLLANLGLVNLSVCVFMLPISFRVMTVQNWVFGKFLCYFLPALQDTPIHVHTLTYVMMAFDRYYYFGDVVHQPRIPSFICAISSWLVAMCIVLPYPIYITYIDLGLYIRTENFQGVGICILNLTESMEPYTRSIFCMTYILPIFAVTYFTIKSNQRLEVEANLVAIRKELRAKNFRYIFNYSTTSSPSPRLALRSKSDLTERGSSMTTTFHASDDDDDIDFDRERETQKYLSIIMTYFFGVMFPLMVLRLARFKIMDTFENLAYMDWIYLVAVWVAFSITCFMPIVYGYWQWAKSKSHINWRISFRRGAKWDENFLQVTPESAQMELTTVQARPEGTTSPTYGTNGKKANGNSNTSSEDTAIGDCERFDRLSTCQVLQSSYSDISETTTCSKVPGPLLVVDNMNSMFRHSDERFLSPRTWNVFNVD